jgi:hypothetical protein
VQLTYGGHPTWFVSEDRFRIAISPLLRRSVGPWTVYPPRRPRARRVRADAIVLPEGTLPHFDLASIRRFAPSTPVYVGPLVDADVIAAMEASGFTVHRVGWAEPIRAGTLELELLAAIGPFDSLGHHALIRSRRRAGGSALIAWDAYAAPPYEQRLADASDLRLVALCDYATLTPPRILGSLLDVAELAAAAHAASRWHESLRTLTRLLGQVRKLRPALLVSGGSLMRRYEGLARIPGCREWLLADSLQALAPDVRCHLIDVGMSATADHPTRLARGTRPAILGSASAIATYRKRQDRFLQAPRPVKLHPGRLARGTPATRERVRAALDELIGPLTMSSVGQAAVSSMKTGLDGRRIAFSLLDPPSPSPMSWVLDLNAMRFVPLEGRRHAAEVCPYGVEIFLGDFLSLLDGDLTIESLVGAGLRAWYPDHPSNSLVQFLLHHHRCRPVGTLWS